MVIQTKTRKWGSSIGVIIPSEVAEKLKIKEDEEVLIEIQKKENPLKELFGSLKSAKSAKEIVDETRKDLESKWM